MSLRVVLLGGAADAAGLAAALRDLGHDAVHIEPPAVAPLETLLLQRGFTGGLTPLPRMLGALAVRDPDLVHAFDASAAGVTLAWARVRDRPAVYTSVEVLTRGILADRRRRLALLRAAVERSDAVTAASPQARDALARWFAVDAPVLGLGDAVGHAALYAELLAR